MSERADPEDPSFRGEWRLRWRRKFIPWLTYSPNPYRRAVVWRYNWVSEHSRGKSVVDVPCGMGWGTSLIKGAKKLVGIDISEEAIKKAQDKYPEHAEFMVGSMTKLPFKDDSIDLVACLEGIEHVPEDVGSEFIEEAKRVLKPGGELMLSSPYTEDGEHSGNPYHIKEYQPQEIEAKLGKHFLIKDVAKRKVGNMVVNYYHCEVKQ